MKVRLFNFNDYAEYASWWQEVAPPMQALPKAGFVIGDMKFVGFLINTDTSFAIMSWWHANPNNKPRETRSAVLKYIDVCKATALSLGKKHLFLYTNKRAIRKILMGAGFVEIDSGHMAYEVL